MCKVSVCEDMEPSKVWRTLKSLIHWLVVHGFTGGQVDAGVDV